MIAINTIGKVALLKKLPKRRSFRFIKLAYPFMILSKGHRI
jgi:hypothetical protein